ncbi:MAG TPA: substrate-binding domain-containing protein [Terrimicrobiaceae bacterium]|nr:substrate-binding domain-containing protein [Terrimicrobiaceae bacterium]
MRPLPKHREIYRALAAEIADGQYDVHRRLPSEAQLVRRFGVSRPTAARALRDLQLQGIVERRVGAGSFIKTGGAKPSAGAEASRQLGLLLPGLEVTEIFEVFCGELASLTRANDYGLLWAGSSHARLRADLSVKDAEAACQHLIDRSVQGVFFAPFEFSSEMQRVSKRTVDQFKAAGIAVVLLDRDLVPFPFRSDLDLVALDNVMAGYLAGEHLAKLGAKKIAFLARPLSAPTIAARVAGAREALIAIGLEPAQNFLCVGEPRDESFVRELIAGRKLEGIICGNDFTAAQLMHTFARLKIRVPEDIRLIAFDNLRYAELLAVPLTTVSQPYREMAANAMRAMLNRLADPTLPATALLSSPHLVVRSSCGAFLPR